MMIMYRKNLAHKLNRRGETMDKVIEALENLVTEIVNDDGVSYEAVSYTHLTLPTKRIV